jgi:hypothetical protein
MAMNFVTFNQDYSYLAVGEFSGLFFVAELWTDPVRSNIKRISDLHH